ncbi:hypothetical protein [Flavobacterium sp. NRK F7]|uniref:hypothetical protein n=1 Tax=Flavobacterium sp. NRK F7 TaxID=2954930 RepID=UPI0020903F7B|nr:hypothetical protein [Flavobacterium sp. NRK F7]MCO6162348.1 hypothetical protein [Flavobacterium sp. NRK F7]
MKKATLLFLFLYQILFSQTIDWNLYKETMALQVNAKTLITGEKLRYSLYCLQQNNQASELSKVAYVKCIDASGKEIFVHKHYLDKGTASGYFFIPTELKTGTYYLLTYTQWMLSASPLNFTSNELLIINPYQENQNEKIRFDTSTVPSSTSPEIELKNYSKREAITFSDFITNEKGNFTISVRKKDAINVPFGSLFSFPNPASNSNPITLLPEAKGELISGKIQRLDSLLPLENIGIALLDKGNKDFIQVTSTNHKGQFHFILARPLHSSRPFLEIISENENYTLELDSKLQPGILAIKQTPTIYLETNYTKEIEKRAIASQIENAYYEIKKDSTFQPKALPSINPNYLEVFPVEKYNRFTSLKEFITEVPNQVYYTEKNDQFKIHFRNTGVQLELNENPLTLVDGSVIINPNDLLKIEYNKIKSIAINIQPYYLGNKLYSGLFIIHTTDGSFEESSTKKWNTEYIVPLYKQQPYVPDYKDKAALERIPDYRTQLLWQQTTSLNQPISFYTSDVEGTYEISIYGYTNEGEFVEKNGFFKVE